ncbi:MAG TPA: hypothetical protein VF432_05590 [Thermoanaerobaculia bacterium]
MRRWQVITFAAFLASVVPLKGELQQIYAPHFAADAVHSSRLVIHNKRVDAEVTLKVYALLEKGERVSLATATLAPKQSRAFKVTGALLRNIGRRETRGGLLIEYDFHEKQPLDASLMVRHRNGSGYVVPLLRRDQIRVSDVAQNADDDPPHPKVTVYIPIHRPPNVGELIARFYDPCANNYLLTFKLSFGLPASAYEPYNTFHYPICYWAPTCQGRCSEFLYRSVAATPSCYPAGQPYIQCFGLSVNGQ